MPPPFAVPAVAVARLPAGVDVRPADAAKQDQNEDDDEDRADGHQSRPFQIRHGAASLELSQALKRSGSSAMPARWSSS